MFYNIKIISICYILVALSSCTTNELIKDKEVAFDNSIKETKDKLVNVDAIVKSYVKVIKPIDATLDKKITNISIKNVNLRDALALVFPEAYVITEGDKVNLATEFDVSARNITYSEYLELLSSLSSYRISLEKYNKLVVSSVAYRRWNVASLASMPNVDTSVGSIAKAGEAANSSQITISKSDDVWEDLLKGIKEILGDSGIVVDNRRLGEIYASGDPDKLILADQWMRKIVESSSKQILLDVAILEVTLSNDEAKGVDWNVVYTKSTDQNFNLGRAAQETLSGGGAWSFVAKYISGRKNINLMVDLLSKQGKVSIQHQPSLTVTNGSTAYLGASDQFSYIKSIKQNITPATDNSAAIITTTPEVEEVSIGVNIAVTARMLDGDNILIEVVPVISSLQSIENLTYTSSDGAQTLRIPRIAIQELSTQVITKSGQPIHLGGLIIERLSKLSKSVAGTPESWSDIIDFLAGGISNAIEKKEILLIITPTEV